MTNLGDSERIFSHSPYFFKKDFICHNFVATGSMSIKFVGNEEHIYLHTI